MWRRSLVLIALLVAAHAAHAAEVGDDFNRSNDSTLGAGWTTAHDGSLTIVSNAAQVAASATYVGNFFNSTLATADQEASVTISGVASNNYFDVKVRGNGSPGAGYDGYQCSVGGPSTPGDAFYAITRYDNGMGTDLVAAVSATIANGDELTCRIEGSTITLLLNGTPVDDATDSTYSSGAYVGLGAYSQSGSPAMRFDDFTARDLGGADLPEIDSVTPSTFEASETGIVIAGSNFGASQGTGTVVICPTDDIEDADCEAQTVTAWADDEITFTAVIGANTEDMTAYLFVTNDSGDSNADGFEVTFLEGETPIVATKLIFGSQPGNVIVGQTFGAFTVRAVDDENNLDESFEDEVTLTLCDGNGTLGGTTANSAVAGIATFNDNHIDTLNNDAALCANSGELTEAESESFDVTAGDGGAAVGFPSSSRLGGVLQ